MNVSKLLEQGDMARVAGFNTRDRDALILEEYARGKSLRQIGAQFKISHTQVSNIIARFRKQVSAQ